MPHSSRSTFGLFGDNRDQASISQQEPFDKRPIARRGPACEHKPTSAAPASLLAPITTEDRESFRRQFQQTERQLRNVLGEPYYANDGFILYNTDCLKAMCTLAKAGVQFSLTVSSPPYNIGKAYDSNRNLDEYLRWCTTWLDAIHAITTAGGALWLNLGYTTVPGKGKAVPIPYLLWDKSPFFLIQEVVWHYGAGVSTKATFSPRNEKWLFFVANEAGYVFNLDAVRDPNVKYPNQRKNGKFRCNPLGKNPSDVWLFPKVTTGAKRSSRERTIHPAQFPLAVVERIVRVSSNAGQVVLDPFSGSGSTGIAAVGTARVYVGFETRRDYCELSVDRHRVFRNLQAPANSPAR